MQCGMRFVEAFQGAMPDQVLLKVVLEEPSTIVSMLVLGSACVNELFPEQCLGATQGRARQ